MSLNHPRAPDPMAAAFAEARAAGSRGEVPIGAAISYADNARQIVAADGNRVEELCDPTAHAEILVIRAAAQVLGRVNLTDCVITVTLEPCAMCAQAIALSRLRRLVFAAYDPKGGGVDHGPRIFQQPTCHHRPEVIGGVDATVSTALLRGFFQARRRP